MKVRVVGSVIFSIVNILLYTPHSPNLAISLTFPDLYSISKTGNYTDYIGDFFASNSEEFYVQSINNLTDQWNYVIIYIYIYIYT